MDPAKARPPAGTAKGCVGKVDVVPNPPSAGVPNPVPSGCVVGPKRDGPVGAVDPKGLPNGDAVDPKREGADEAAPKPPKVDVGIPPG